MNDTLRFDPSSKNHCDSQKNYSAPGKVFLLGEYAVLAGCPALVGTLRPRFRLCVRLADPEQNEGLSLVLIQSPFADASPAGRLIASVQKERADWLKQRPLIFEFEEPYGGLAGFGSSTAQYALAYKALAELFDWPDEQRRWKAVWSSYRRISDCRGCYLPSGADLVAQWHGGLLIFDPQGPRTRDVTALFDTAGLLVFSAAQLPGRKVPTHEHLATLQELPAALLAQLHGLVEQAIRALEAGDNGWFGRVLVEYAEALNQAGLEDPRASEERRRLMALPGVLGAKGCGALLSDAMLVCVDAQRPAVGQAVIHEAKRLGLRLVAEGWVSEMGTVSEVWGQRA